MPRTKQPRPEQPTTREAVGAFVADFIPYRGMSVLEAGNKNPNLSPMTINRIIDGNEKVMTQKYLTLAGILDLPPRLFLMMIAGDAKSIELLPMADDVKQMVLATLATASPTAHNRRAADA